VNVKLVNDQRRLKRLTAKPTFKAFKIYHNDLAAVNLKLAKIVLNRPTYVGFSILDISKLLMYDFHYNHIRSEYGPKAKLLFTDTDSLCYEVSTDNIYADMAKHINFYDTSEYPVYHPLYNTQNKKVLGKMKDECAGKVIQEFVGLRSKMYSIKFGKVEKKTAKGIKKSVIKQQLKHAMYRDCLFERK
jgi:hypothetical protein